MVKNYHQNKEFVKEIKSLGLNLDSTVRDILEELQKNKKKIFNILMDDNKSIIREYLMENLGLGDDVILSLNRILLKEDFIDIESFFESLKMFFSLNFESLDVVIYKFNKHKKNLEFFLGSNHYLGNISLDLLQSGEYKNELKSLNSTDEKLFTSSGDFNNSYGGIGSIKINSMDDIYIMSFYKKVFLRNFQEEDFKNDILRIKKLFNRFGLLNLIKIYIESINKIYKDQLTGLLNGRYLESMVNHMKFSVLFIDLNHFKKVNDTYGHDAGDRILIELSSILKDSVRPQDKVFRIHGDEFLILIPTNDIDEIDLIKSRINKCLEKKIFTFTNLHKKEKESFNISRAIGYQTAKSGESLKDVIKKADEDMYKEKNRVSRFQFFNFQIK